MNRSTSRFIFLVIYLLLLSKLSIFLLHVFPVFTLSSGILKCLSAALSLIYVEVTVLIKLLFFLIPGILRIFRSQ